jgi:hypothetical protein
MNLPHLINRTSCHAAVAAPLEKGTGAATCCRRCRTAAVPQVRQVRQSVQLALPRLRLRPSAEFLPPRSKIETFRATRESAAADHRPRPKKTRPRLGASRTGFPSSSADKHGLEPFVGQRFGVPCLPSKRAMMKSDLRSCGTRTDLKRMRKR